MATKIKGICKGSFKYISQIFVVKEHEMEIGYPTDVKHVAHIGWDGPDGTAPSWMNEFKTGSETATGSMSSMTSISLGGSRDQTWTSQDFEQTLGRQSSSAKLSNFPPTNIPSIPKKQRRKKIKSSSSSPKSSSSRSSRSSKSTLWESEKAESRRSSVNL